MKLLNLLIFSLLFIPISWSQECGTDALMMGVQRFARAQDPPPIVDLDTAQVITIPLVFHVVHLGEPLGEGTNISYEQLQSAVVALNEDFRKIEGTNGDGIGVDTKIQFCLASRTPDNAPTSGIVRHNGNDLIYTCPSGSNSGEVVTYAERGVQGASCTSLNFESVPADYMKQFYGCWDLDDYLNIWIVSEIEDNEGGNGIQGFSYVGSTGNSFCRNGIVQLYNVTGTMGTLKVGRTKNRTLTHEMGHALGLYHTFGFSSNGCEETNCETQGDQVCDTPPTLTNTSCTTPSCNEAMLENYMDYTPEDCKDTFTQGQAERMREELWSSWGGFTNSLGCYPVVSLDGGISNLSVESPSCITTFDVFVSIANYGSQSLSNPIITLSNGETTESTQVSMTLMPQEIESFSFEFNSSSTSVISASVSFDEDEELTENNYESAEFVYQEGSALKVEVSPDFWSNEIDWELVDEDGEVIAFDGDWGGGNSGIVFTKNVCLFGGCYTFNMTDIAGDGMCTIDFGDDGICDVYSDAFIRLTLNSEIIYELSEAYEIDFGSELEFSFCDEILGCEGDLDSDGVVDVQDLLILLAGTGCIANEDPCLGDVNEDGQTDVNDLLILIANMGNTCPSVIEVEITPSKSTYKRSITSVKTGYYDLQGRYLGIHRGSLRSGVYLLVEGSNSDLITKKVLIR